jgi:hypothetical protein
MRRLCARLGWRGNQPRDRQAIGGAEDQGSESEKRGKGKNGAARHQPERRERQLAADMKDGANQGMGNRAKQRARQANGNEQTQKTGKRTTKREPKPWGEKRAQQQAAGKYPDQGDPGSGAPIMLQQCPQHHDIGKAGFDPGNWAGQGCFRQAKSDGKRSVTGDAPVLSSNRQGDRMVVGIHIYLIVERVIDTAGAGDFHAHLVGQAQRCLAGLA